MFCFGPLSVMRPSTSASKIQRHHPHRGGPEPEIYQISHHTIHQQQQRFIPKTRSPLSQSHSCDANVKRARSFMAFVSRWFGLDYLKGKLEKRRASQMKTSSSKSDVVAGGESKRAKAEPVQTVEPVSIVLENVVEHCLASSARLNSTQSSKQIIYEVTNSSFTATEVTDRILLSQNILGTGSFAEVRKAYDQHKRVYVACKIFKAQIILQNARLQETLKREIHCLTSFSHPNVVQFHGLLVTKEHICILMELIEGEEFFHYLSTRGAMTEEDAKPILHQLVSTLVRMHDNGIVHRDLKLENIMLVKDKGTGRRLAKIIDFGLARYDAVGSKIMKTRCGSEEYAAPEILLGLAYQPKLCDAWSFGVVLYTCLIGRMPFNPDHTGVRSLSSKIIAGKYYLPDNFLSREAAALIRSLLVTDPLYRMDLHFVLSNSSFFKR